MLERNNIENDNCVSTRNQLSKKISITVNIGNENGYKLYMQVGSIHYEKH